MYTSRYNVEVYTCKNYVNYTVMLLFESPSGTILKKDLEIQGLFFRL